MSREPSPVRIVDVVSSDVEAVSGAGGGWQGRNLQVSRGTMQYRSRRLLLPGLGIRRHETDATLHGLWSNDRGAFSLLWGDSDAPLAWHGSREVATDRFLFQHAGPEHDMLFPAGYRCWDLDVYADTRHARGWVCTMDATPPLPPRVRAALDHLCAAAFTRALIEQLPPAGSS